MTDDYTPTTEDVREDFAFPWSPEQIGDRPARVAAFDRWLAAHDAEVRAGVVAEEWISYARGIPGEFMIPESKGPNYATHQRTVKAGPWVPVKQEGESDEHPHK